MSTNKPPVVTIDGPTGSGKGTLALKLAKKLGWHYLESGLLYRLLGLVAIEKGLDFDCSRELAELALRLQERFEVQEKEASLHIFLQGEDVTQRIRHEDCSLAASKISAYPAVRNALLACQRGFQQPPGLVADGRDMGTVVFPKADLKIFLKADPKIRAERRYKQLKEKGIDASLQEIMDGLKLRDHRDSHRGAAPLKPAVDAVVIDTGHKSAQNVLDCVMELCKQRALI